MSGIDYLILGIIVISATIGIWRGFVREALSLIVWVAAFWLAYAWASTLEVMLVDLLADQAVRIIICFVVLFLMVHVAGFVLSRLLSSLIRSIGLKGVDRVAGAGFGFVRGFIAVVALVLLVDMTPLTQHEAWQQSITVPMFKDAIEWAQLNYPLDNIGSAFAAATD